MGIMVASTVSTVPGASNPYI